MAPHRRLRGRLDQALVDRLERGAYAFAGVAEPFAGVLGEGEGNPYATGERHPEDDR